MEGQDKIEINKMDINGDEGQGNVQNNDDILDQRNEAWSRMNHFGWRPFKALGHRHTKEFWLILVIIALPNKR